jgi:hypothetical protein
MENDLSDEILEYIEEEIRKTGYGRVVVELNKKANFIDVISERRKRFEKGKKKLSDNIQPGIRNG